MHVQPGASATAIAGWHDGRVRVRLAAAPVGGAANAALIRYLAKRLGISRSRVTITAGAHGRRKTVVADGVAIPEVLAALGLEPPL